MSQKIFLTSAIAMGVVAPAFADPTYTSDTFPSTGLMQEDYTYKNAATATNMDSVYEGSVNAVAEYEDIFYDIVAGNYLAAGSDDEDGTICPAGSYCSGLTHAPYNATENQGITSCPTGYALSAAGAKTEAECYRQCTASDVAHSKATGTFTGMFYSNNTNACEPVNDESCANGYHYKEGNPGLNLDTSINGDSNRYKSITYGGSNSSDTTGLNSGDWDVTFSYGIVTGKALCSTTNKTGSDSYPTGTPDESGSGKYCWCQLDGYKPVNSSKQSFSGAWVYTYDAGNSWDCGQVCAINCARDLLEYKNFRTAMFGAVQPTPAMCEANTITINWSDVNTADVTANNAGTATYGSDVRTPVKANTYKGKTFKGWRFSKPEQTNL